MLLYSTSVLCPPLLHIALVYLAVVGRRWRGRGPFCLDIALMVPLFDEDERRRLDPYSSIVAGYWRILNPRYEIQTGQVMVMYGEGECVRKPPLLPVHPGRDWSVILQ